jgi:crotonobetainyl-CoA:carnitine CoA-transferase CaiB-like acyl-CoA transferase
MNSPRPLEGIRVLELGQLLAGPFAGTILGYFGAEVIKVEPPGDGDPIRNWRLLDEGTSVWWRSLGRNKKCISVDLRLPEGRELVKNLAAKVDVLIENFKPGTLEKWGLGPDELKESNPGLIFARVSGYGQTGPKSHLPGYASVCEGVGGLRYVNGIKGEAPMRPNLSLGDTLAGIHTALGICLALIGRLRHQSSGQVVDVSIVESIFNCLEAVVPEYDRFGAVREPAGATITGVVPSNTYPTADGAYVIIGANGESNYKRLMIRAGRPDLAEDPRLQSNAGRVEHQQLVDEAVAAWTSSLPASEILAALEEAQVPAGPIYSVADMFADPQFAARGLFEEVETPTGPLKVPAILPRLAGTPGRTEFAGPELGSANREVLRDLLGLGDEEIGLLEERKVL